ncbi:GGDEF domain-containing protein [Enterobacteriaceae bacterium 89]|jgi:diguanylate cyclase (GGDEF)-like protein|nr:GGDEF domain-containing protein [Enterobacteriaceae bacterium 89]
MLVRNTFPYSRLLIFLGGAVLAIAVLHLFSSQIVYRTPQMSPVLFPVMTIFLMIFHILVASFMFMKYLCDKHRLYLMAIACAFGGSAVLMLGTLSSYSEWLMCTSLSNINYNDALIYYFFRNIMMAVLFICSIFLYTLRHRDIHSVRNHIIAITLMVGFTLGILILSWFYSSHHPRINLTIIDNLTRNFTPLWHNYLIGTLITIWCLTLIVMLVITRMRNIFWFSGYFFCAFFIFTLCLLLPADSIAGYSWYKSRLFETTATLFLIFVLLCDVFTLYRVSNNKYQSSYQNSIRDPMTRLFNRSYFYDALTKQMAKVSSASPVSVIVCDLDHFKRINDRYGHLQGDKVIQFVAGVLQDSVRATDVAARIGGEEFALLLTNTHPDAAAEIAERIRKTVSEHDEQSSNQSLPERITISVGVFTATAQEKEIEICVQRADEAMYQAKENGRNRVEIWQN